MRTIRLRNFRSLRDTRTVELRPLTLLLGRNASGKSSFLRVLPMLRQSVETRTRSPILWYGNYVDFGSFADVLRKGATVATVDLEFGVCLSPRPHVRRTPLIVAIDQFGMRHRPIRLADSGIDVTVRLSLASEGGLTVPNGLLLAMDEDRISIKLGDDGGIGELHVNGESLSELVQEARWGLAYNSILPALAHGLQVEHRLSALEQHILHLFSAWFHGNTDMEKRLTLIRRVPVANAETMLAAIKSLPAGAYFRERVRLLRGGSPEYRRARNALLALAVPQLLRMAAYEIDSAAGGVAYIAPIRATAERYYRARELAVDVIDHQGANLSMFLRSMSRANQDAFSRWTAEQLGFSVNVRTTKGHLYVELAEVGAAGAGVNLADTGFGFSQVLPIVAQVWASAHTSRPRGAETQLLFAIEQPELHLHPAMQARVADMFVVAIGASGPSRPSLRFIVETHSQPLVNRIGAHIARGALRPDDVNVLVFEKNADHSSSRIRRAHFDDDGYLHKWPHGFFEPEAEKW